MRILVTQQVHDTVMAATERGRSVGIEFGGSLLAVETDDSLLLAYALPTGEQAAQEYARLVTDAEFQNQTLQRVQERLPQLRYVGDWHVHPMWLPMLSATDCRTAGLMLEEELPHLARLVLLLGTARDGEPPVLCGFVVRRGEVVHSPLVACIELTVVANDSAEVQQLLGSALPPLTELMQERIPEMRSATHPNRPSRISRMRSRITKVLSQLKRPPPVDTLIMSSELAQWMEAGPDTELLGTAEPYGDGLCARVLSLHANEGLIHLGTLKIGDRESIPERFELSPGPPLTATRKGQPVRVIVSDAVHYRDRVSSLPVADRLVGKTVLLVGLGSVGSAMGALLARIGVRIVGCDPDLLLMENLIRWGMPASLNRHVGRPKASVFAELIRETVPDAQVDTHALDVVREEARFLDLVTTAKPDLIIAATDTRDSRRVINAAAVLRKTPLLVVALSDGASSVRIEVVPSAIHGPCHLCSTLAEDGAGPRMASRASRKPYGVDLEPSAVPALPVDVTLGATLAAKIALLVLAGEDWRAYFRNGEQSGNVLFVGLRPDFWVFEQAWDRLVYPAEPHPACPQCASQAEEAANGRSH